MIFIGLPFVMTICVLIQKIENGNSLFIRPVNYRCAISCKVKCAIGDILGLIICPNGIAK